MQAWTDRSRGLFITILGVMILTPDALLIRLGDADPLTVLIWRGILSAVTLLGFNMWFRRSSVLTMLRKMSVPAWGCVVLMAGSNIFFVTAITYTAAANALVILAALPVLSAVLAFVFQRQFQDTSTWVSIACASFGIGIVFWGQFGGGSIVGDAAALMAALCLASAFVILNDQPDIDSIVVTGLAALLAACVAAAMGGDPTNVQDDNMIFLFLNGAVVLPLSFALITYGPKLITAAEVSLIMLLETVLGPLWVWLAVAEEPSVQTLIGGVFVVSAIAGKVLWDHRSVRA